jgi:phage gp29-like protein
MREGWKFWAVYLERFGSPLVRATVPRTTTPAERKELEDVISSIQQRTGLVIPEGVAIEFVEATRSGTASYREFIEEQKEAIAIVVLGQTLTTYVGSRGPQALGTVHERTKEEILAADAEAIATVVNEQIIRRLVDANYAGIERYPVWTWEMTDVRDLESFARVVVRLRNTGIRVPTEWVYRTFGIPIPQEGEGVLGEGERRDGELSEVKE